MNPSGMWSLGYAVCRRTEAAKTKKGKGMAACPSLRTSVDISG